MLKDKNYKKNNLCVSFYHGYRISSFNPLMQDAVLIDWQLRLLSYITNKYSPVFVKQHPESPERMAAFFSDELGVIPIEGRFEDVITKEDICLFDYQATTVFGYAVKNGNPIVFINFDTLFLDENDQRLLEDRVSLVSGFYDGKNRACINWSELDKALQSCQDLVNNNGFQVQVLVFNFSSHRSHGSVVFFV